MSKYLFIVPHKNAIQAEQGCGTKFGKAEAEMLTQLAECGTRKTHGMWNAEFRLALMETLTNRLKRDRTRPRLRERKRETYHD